MEKVSHFKSLIREEKTLIIACHKQESGKIEEWDDRVFIISSPGNPLHRYDFRQQEFLRHYIEEKGCRQILVVGHLHAEAATQIAKDNTVESPLSALTFNLKSFMGNQDRNVFPNKTRELNLVELNVIQQCKLLLENNFIQERVESKSIHVIGIIASTRNRNATQVFYNGISYNNLITLN